VRIAHRTDPPPSGASRRGLSSSGVERNGYGGPDARPSA
jgi:hypothetical protein